MKRGVLAFITVISLVVLSCPIFAAEFTGCEGVVQGESYLNISMADVNCYLAREGESIGVPGLIMKFGEIEMRIGDSGVRGIKIDNGRAILLTAMPVRPLARVSCPEKFVNDLVTKGTRPAEIRWTECHVTPRRYSAIVHVAVLNVYLSLNDVYHIVMENVSLDVLPAVERIARVWLVGEWFLGDILLGFARAGGLL